MPPSPAPAFESVFTLVRSQVMDALENNDLSVLRTHLTPDVERSADTIERALRPTRIENPWVYAVRYSTAVALDLMAPFVDVRQGELGNPPIMTAVVAGNLDTIQALLQRWGGDEDLAEVDGQGHDTLQIAVMHGQPNVVELLLDHLASPYETARAFNLAVHKERWATADRLAARPELPEHRIALKLDGRRDSNDEPLLLPQWNARRETRELNDAVASLPVEPVPAVRPRL